MGLEGFIITKAIDIGSALRKYRDNYNSKGQYLGFENIDKHYTMMLGTCTDWTGFPMSGKTQVLMELLMNTSIYYGWKHLVYFPDVGNNIEIIADLIHKKIGKSFDPTAKNAITDMEINREIDWITEHFKVLTKSDVKAKLTPFEFWDYAVELKKSEGLHTACIDSWKDLSHPYDKYGGYATYLEVVLPYRNQIAEDNELHLHTIIHPKLTEKTNGKRTPPTPYDLKGGSEWFNSGKCMITVHREDISSNKAEIFFNKIKPRSCGEVGDTVLFFDVEKLVYYTNGLEPVNGSFEKNYASPKGEKKVETFVPKQLPLSTSFDEPKDNLPF